jgi:hypothetical protein
MGRLIHRHSWHRGPGGVGNADVLREEEGGAVQRLVGLVEDSGEDLERDQIGTPTG